MSKLRTLIEAEGYATLDGLLNTIITDSVCPAICSNTDCDFMCEMEPDQTRGWCEECSTNTMQSALVLAGVI